MFRIIARTSKTSLFASAHFSFPNPRFELLVLVIGGGA